jgi:arylsulfatase A-like enzyme
MNRLLLLFSLLMALVAAAPVPAATRPNFLLIYTDDQRWDALGVVQREQGEKARFPWLRTPNLDRLAAEGVRFRNAFVVNSLCAPSRASFLTGRYGHFNGVVNNHTPFPESNVTFASLLRGAGYRTGYVGKWHMGSQSGRRPGFDYSASFVGQGKYYDCPFEVNGKTTETKGWIDDVSTDYAQGFLQENKDRPFALVLGFKTTHSPCEPTPAHKDDYAGEQARAVPSSGINAIYNGGGKRPASPAPGDKVPANLNYFRTVSSVDDSIGRVLKTLDDLKLTENTVVVFASDNGYYLGEHSLGDKRSAYDESLRIPLIVRYPPLKRQGTTAEQMALNTDLAPTFLDYAGVPVPKEVQGRSLRPVLEAKNAEWRQAYFYAYFYEKNYRIPAVTAVRTAAAKLIRYPDHPEWTELFDLRGDPYETRNLIADPDAADLRRELEATYEREKNAIAFRIPEFADRPDQDARAPLKATVLEFHFDRDEGDRITDASGKNNPGTSHGAPLVDGRNGGKARRFDGKGYLEIGKSASLDPAVAGWTLDVTFKSDRPDGVLLACGGRSQGYALYLESGKPVFAVTANNRTSRVTATQTVGHEWVRVTARVTGRLQLRLGIDGKPAGQSPLHDYIGRQPNEGLQIGADLGSTVEDRMLPQFVGLIEAVRVYNGEAP